MVYAMIIMCIAQLSAGNSTIMDSSAGAAALDTSLISLQPVGKWSRCFSNGRMDLIFEVRTVTEGGSKLFTGLTLPGTAAKCSASKPSQCKTLVACEAATSCQKFFPGELSGACSRSCFVRQSSKCNVHHQQEQPALFVCPCVSLAASGSYE